MSRLVFPSEFLSNLRIDLLKDSDETCAVLLGRSVRIGDHLARITVRESVLPPRSAYSVRTAIRSILRPEFVAEISQRAKRNNESLIFVHTHPFPLNEFSAIDDEGEEALAEFLRYRLPDAVHAAMLITPEKYLARQLGRNEALKIIGVGPEIHSELSPVHSENSERFDRQIRAFGRAGQDTLRGMRVGVVGLGGTGSVVLQELCYLGVKNFLLIDPDIVELSNLNRLAGATPDSVGRAKVDVARRWSLQICPDAQVEAVQDSVLKASVARTLADTDFVFSCTDSHGSRAVLNQLSYQYLVPLIDMGVVIATQKRQITHVAARTQMLAPGLACMVCGNLLDPEEVRRDLLTDFERKADPYIIGHTEPAPAVISLNATIASLAITMFLNAVTGIPGSARFLNYDAIRGFCRPAYCTPHPSCVVCSLQGALARSDEWPLPARID